MIQESKGKLNTVLLLKEHSNKKILKATISILIYMCLAYPQSEEVSSVTGGNKYEHQMLKI